MDPVLSFLGGLAVGLIGAFATSLASLRAAQAARDSARISADAATHSATTAAETARAVAEQTLRGQRSLARDEAVRRWRADHVVGPYLDAAYRRRGVIQDALNAAGQFVVTTDPTQQANWLQEIQRLYTQLHREQKVTNIAYRSVQIEEFKNAVAQLSDADGECLQAVEVLLDATAITAPNARRLEDGLAKFTTTLVAAVAQSEIYINQPQQL